MSKKIGNGNYYNEIGIKIAGCRLSVRFPTGAPAAQKSNIQTQEEEFDYGAICKKVDHYRSDWTWVPVRSTSTKVLSKPNRPLPPPPQAAPPVPPRAASPSVPPTSALPPYPSSTVSRKSSKSSRFSKSSRCSSTSSSILPESRISSYVWIGWHFYRLPPNWLQLAYKEDYLPIDLNISSTLFILKKTYFIVNAIRSCLIR